MHTTQQQITVDSPGVWAVDGMWRWLQSLDAVAQYALQGAPPALVRRIADQQLGKGVRLQIGQVVEVDDRSCNQFVED